MALVLPLAAPPRATPRSIREVAAAVAAAAVAAAVVSAAAAGHRRWRRRRELAAAAADCASAAAAGGGGPRFSGGGPRFGGGAGLRGGGYGRRLSASRTMAAAASLSPAAVIGGVIGGALASAELRLLRRSTYGYYDDGYYYDDARGRGGASGGDDAVAYCMQTLSSPTIRARAPISAMTACGTPARNEQPTFGHQDGASPMRRPFAARSGPQRQRDAAERHHQRGDFAQTERLVQHRRRPPARRPPAPAGCRSRRSPPAAAPAPRTSRRSTRRTGSASCRASTPSRRRTAPPDAAARSRARRSRSAGSRCPICQAASDSGGIASGKCLVRTVPSATQTAPASAHRNARQLVEAGVDAVAADQHGDAAERDQQRDRARRRQPLAQHRPGQHRHPDRNRDAEHRGLAGVQPQQREPHEGDPAADRQQRHQQQPRPHRAAAPPGSARRATAISASAAAPTMPHSPRDDSGGHSVSRFFMIGKLRPQPTDATPETPAGRAARSGRGDGRSVVMEAMTSASGTMTKYRREATGGKIRGCAARYDRSQRKTSKSSVCKLLVRRKASLAPIIRHVIGIPRLFDFDPQGHHLSVSCPLARRDRVAGARRRIGGIRRPGDGGTVPLPKPRPIARNAAPPKTPPVAARPRAANRRHRLPLPRSNRPPGSMPPRRRARRASRRLRPRWRPPPRRRRPTSRRWRTSSS